MILSQLLPATRRAGGCPIDLHPTAFEIRLVFWVVFGSLDGVVQLPANGAAFAP
jgi:hypothetical protein